MPHLDDVMYHVTINSRTVHHSHILCNMELPVRQEMCSLLETLTHSGRPSLDQQLMKRVKGICKSVHLYFTSILILNLTFVCYTQTIRLLCEG